MKTVKLTLLVTIILTAIASSLYAEDPTEAEPQTISSNSGFKHFALGTATAVGLAAELYSLLGMSIFMRTEFARKELRLGNILAYTIATTALLQSGYGLSKSAWNSFKEAFRSSKSTPVKTN